MSIIACQGIYLAIDAIHRIKKKHNPERNKKTANLKSIKEHNSEKKDLFSYININVTDVRNKHDSNNKPQKDKRTTNFEKKNMFDYININAIDVRTILKRKICSIT